MTFRQLILIRKIDISQYAVSSCQTNQKGLSSISGAMRGLTSIASHHCNWRDAP